MKNAFKILSAFLALTITFAALPNQASAFSKSPATVKKVAQNSDGGALAAIAGVQPQASAVAQTAKKAAANAVSVVPFRSDAMKTDIMATVVLPDAYFTNPEQRFPVVYLLHGFGGSHKTWIGIRPDLQRLASMYSVIIVCPDGKTSWYWDAPKKPQFKFETFVSKELVSQVDKKYRTIADRTARAITGLSMGGHGGLWLGFRHQDVFGACGATSGGVDIRPFPRAWKMSENLGERDSNKEIWDSHTVINQLDRLVPNKLAIIIDCGTEDFFYKVNENLHAELLKRKIPHDYITRPGKHNSPYWRNSIAYQLMFFDSYFHDKNFLWTRLGAPKKN